MFRGVAGEQFAAGPCRLDRAQDRLFWPALRHDVRRECLRDDGARAGHQRNARRHAVGVVRNPQPNAPHFDGIVQVRQRRERLDFEQFVHDRRDESGFAFFHRVLKSGGALCRLHYCYELRKNAPKSPSCDN